MGSGILLQLDFLQEEKGLRFRLRSWRVKAGAELICADRLLVGAINSRVFVVAVQEEFGGAEVICCAQVAVAGAYAMTGSQLRISFSGNPFGCGIPLVIPAFVVAISSPEITPPHNFACSRCKFRVLKNRKTISGCT